MRKQVCMSLVAIFMVALLLISGNPVAVFANQERSGESSEPAAVMREKIDTNDEFVSSDDESSDKIVEFAGDFDAPPEDTKSLSETPPVGSNDGELLQDTEQEVIERTDDAENAVEEPLEITRDALNEKESGNDKVLSPAVLEAKETATKLYLNGVSGDDTNDGLTPEKALKTFEKAKEMATSNQQITEIIVTGKITLVGDVSLEGTKAVIIRGDLYSGYLIEVPRGKTTNLTNITVDGNSKNNIATENSLIYVQGILNISHGALLQNNKLTPSLNARGGAIFSSRGKINMSGGEIKSNSAVQGGGVYLNSSSTMNMTGGAIYENNAVHFKDGDSHYGGGGGVAIMGTSVFNLSGSACISNNTAAERGGGVSLGLASYSDGSSFNMSGGTIVGNTAGSVGGGIFIQAEFGSRKTIATITGGSITNNQTDGTGQSNKMFGGGGIYVNGIKDGYYGYKWTSGELHLKNAIITNNEAKIDGGAMLPALFQKRLSM